MPELGRRDFLRLAALTSAVAVSAGCGSAAVSDTALDIACGEPGGTYIQFGRLLTAALERSEVTSSARALPSHGSVENLQMLQDGKAALAMTLADSAAINAWKPAAIGRVYQNYLQCVVRADSDISTLADLAGRSVSIGAPGSGTAQTAERVLSAAGLIGSTELQKVELATAATKVGTGDLDALIWSGGLPAPAVVQLSDMHPVRLIDLSAMIPGLNAIYGGVYQPAIVAANTYGQDDDIATIGVSNFLVCRPDLPEEVAAAIVDVLIDSARDLVPEPSVGIQYLTAETLIDTSPIPLHAGAVARYRDRHG